MNRPTRLADLAPPVPWHKLPPMHALAAFEAAARLQTFARAAEELCVTHSAVSHWIRQLEAHLGVRLFVRVHKHVILTPHGERLLAGVREGMHQVAAAAASVGAPPATKLRITSTPGFATHILIPHLREFIAAAPVEIEVNTSNRLVDLHAEGYDVAIRMGSGSWPGYERTLLWKEHVAAYSSPEYAERFGGERTLDTLRSVTLIHCEPFSWAAWLRAISPSARVPVASGPVFEEVWAAIDAAVAGIGVTLANDVTSLRARRQGKLVPFLSDSVDLERHYYGVHRADSPKHALIVRLLEWVAGVVRSELADASGTVIPR